MVGQVHDPHRRPELLGAPTQVHQAPRVGGDDHSALGAGDNLIVWSRNVDGHVQVFAELHPAQGVTLAKAMPVYRIDDGTPIDTDEIRARGDSNNAMWGLTNERTSFWLLLDSPSPVVKATDALHPWLVGQELHLTVMTRDGSMREMLFPLTGSAAAIRKATGVHAE